MVHVIENKPKNWIVWAGTMLKEEVGLTPEQISQMIKDGSLVLGDKKPDFVKITDDEDEKVYLREVVE
jgi:hypothetical protein